MLNMNIIEKNPHDVALQLGDRGYYEPLEPLIHTWNTLKEKRLLWEKARALQKKGMGTLDNKEHLRTLATEIQDLEQQVEKTLLKIPNIAHATTPIGQTALDNKEIFRKEAPTPVTDQPCVHADVAAQLDLHPDKAAKITGARFHVLGPIAARLQRKLMQYAMDFYADEHGYQEHWVPHVVHQNTLKGTGQWPKFQEELFALNTQEPWYLIPTGEVPLTNLVAGETIHEKKTPNPIRLMTTTACFRQEAGAAGRDTRGLLRQHQFEKLELVHICGPHQGEKELENMLNNVRAFLDTLPIGYRIVELCTQDMGFAGHKAYDVEAWFAGAQAWREIATLTWCADFQGRRMQTRYVQKDGTKTFAHTLNGTGLAIGRVMAALFETYFDPKDDMLKLPKEFLDRLG